MRETISDDVVEGARALMCMNNTFPDIYISPEMGKLRRSFASRKMGGVVNLNPVSEQRLSMYTSAQGMVIIDALFLTKQRLFAIISSYGKGKYHYHKITKEPVPVLGAVYPCQSNFVQLFVWMLRYEAPVAHAILDQLEAEKRDWFGILFPAWCQSKEVLENVMQKCYK